MTEPPEPRHPEGGGGEEDYDATWENADADEIMGGLEDDALLDSIAQGVRGELGPDELTELLSGLRDEPDATDIPMKNTARVERGENVLEPPGPKETSERNNEPVSQLSELAAQVASHADMTPLINALAEVEQAFQAKKSALMGLLEDTGHSGAVVQAIAQAQESLAGVLPQINQAGEVITGAARALQGGS